MRKSVYRWKKKARRAVQLILPFFTTTKERDKFTRLERRRENIINRDAEIHQRRVRALLEQHLSHHEAEVVVGTSDHSTRHPHDLDQVGKSPGRPNKHVHKQPPTSRKLKFNWNIWKW
jgi:SpoVK/Ycf46/Vps4 family AAA+-type ATPase